MEAPEQIALQMPAIDGFLDHFLLFVIPHGIVQHIIQYTQRPQFSGTHMAQVGAVVAAVGTPVFLLPTGVTRSAVNKFVQLLWIIYTIIQRQIILKATVILPGCCTTSDTLWTQIRNILNGEERIGIKDMSGLTATVAANTLFGLIKSPSIQRVWVIPKGRQTQLEPLFFLALLFFWRLGFRDSIMVSPIFRIVFQRTQPLECFFIGAISDLTEQVVGILLKVQ